MALVGVYSWWKTRGHDMSDPSGYFLGGNSIGGIVICMSLVMTDLSAEQLVGNNGQSVFVGMGVWVSQGTFWTGLVITALFILPALIKAGVITLPQFFESRFDKATRAIIAIIMILSYIIVFLPTAFYAGSQIFVNLLHLDKRLGVSFNTAIIIVIALLAILSLCYVMFGGLRAVAMSDSVFGWAMMAVGIVIPITAIIFLSNQLGGDGTFLDGLDKFVNTRPEMMNAINEWNSNAPWWPWPVIITGLVINNIYFAGANQSIIQRALAGKSLAQAQKGVMLAGLVDFFTPIFLVIPGIVAALAMPGMDWGNGDTVFGTICGATLPTWFMGIFGAIIFGAILSTVNGLVNSIQTMFAMDVYKTYINQDADNKKIVKIGRIFGFAVTVLAAIFAPILMNLSGVTTFIQSSLAILNSPIAVTLLYGIYSKKASPFAIKIMMVFHIVAYCLLNYFLPSVIPALGAVHFFYWTAVLFALDCLIVTLISKVRPVDPSRVIKDAHAYQIDMTPWKHRKAMAFAIIGVTVAFYMVFSPWGLGKSNTTTWKEHLKEQNSTSMTQVEKASHNAKIDKAIEEIIQG